MERLAPRKITRPRQVKPAASFREVLEGAKAAYSEPLDRPDNVHLHLWSVDSFLTNRLARALNTSVPYVQLSPKDRERLGKTIDTLSMLLYRDPPSYARSISDRPGWSLNMLIWIAIGKATVLFHSLYRLHESFKMERAWPNHVSADRRALEVFEELAVSGGGTAQNAQTPFIRKFMHAPSDSGYLRACAAVSSNKPVLCMTMSELCLQIRTIHTGFVERIGYHPDVGVIVTLLEMRAFLLSVLAWTPDTIDIPPLSPGHNLLPLDQSTANGAAVSSALSRSLEGTRDRVLASHRFIYEMHLFFMIVRCMLRAYTVVERIPVTDLEIPGWEENACASLDDASKRTETRGESWKRFVREMQACAVAIQSSDTSREGMSRMLRSMTLRPCDRDIFMREAHVIQTDATQVWYEFRPGEAVNHTRMLFAPSLFDWTSKSTHTIPNPRFEGWTTLGGGSSGWITPYVIDGADARRTLTVHTIERDIINCKLAGSMISGYVKSSNDSDTLVWQDLFLIGQSDFAKNPSIVLRGNTGLPRIVQLMSRFYVSAIVGARNFFIETGDMETSVFVWLYLIHTYHNGIILDTFDIRKLTRCVFCDEESRHRRVMATKDSKAAETEDGTRVLLQPTT